MLESLMEMEVAYSLLKETQGAGSEDVHPIDAHYAKLNSVIEALEKSSEEYLDIQKYVANTHAPTHSNYNLEILEGLRIAPPEAPVTGYMFGKGVYFADMVSKSANYCMTSPANPNGLLLLCQVALGDMYERTRAEYVEKLPPGKHSVKGLGATAPDPKEYKVTSDDVVIPYGKPVAAMDRTQTSLLYNEYPFLCEI
ncbi:unnamed protein product [Nesidiocoris tenuis]|uniref:Poly [ADP-ribose] polymerase n=1 Tax=Nesidiocoris tenuis TaxID=355587 RepID=A0A6H5GI28_9HEMI|nr:unnamed protein product [Nesidiocoris tenuis]